MYNRIKELCKERHISVGELEEQSGITQRTICRWDKNAPSIDKVIKVADYFDISLDELCGRKKSDFANDLTSDFAKTPQISTIKSEILTLYSELNEEGQEVALNILKTLANTDVYKKCNLYEVVEEA